MATVKEVIDTHRSLGWRYWWTDEGRMPTREALQTAQYVELEVCAVFNSVKVAIPHHATLKRQLPPGVEYIPGRYQRADRMYLQPREARYHLPKLRVTLCSASS